MKTVFVILAVLSGIAILWPFREKIIGFLRKPNDLASTIDALISPKSTTEKPADSSDLPPRKG